MKKLLLPGVAALLLATGAAHAGAERVCPVKQLANGEWDDAEAMECMARINRTIKFHETGHWVFKSPPPPEFDKPYEGILATFRMPLADVQKMCTGFWQQKLQHDPHAIGAGQNMHACSFVRQMNLSHVGDRVVCYIIMPTDDEIRQYREDPQDIIRHETGHCNGWGPGHPNSQGKWEWVEK
jgi:hypothetical protein